VTFIVQLHTVPSSINYIQIEQIRIWGQWIRLALTVCLGNSEISAMHRVCEWAVS